MKLHLIRHAKTEQFSPTGKDFDRELMKRGRKQCVELNQFLNNQDLKDTLVFCSSARRTKETLSYLMSNFSNRNCFFDKELYLCSLKSHLDFLWKMNQQKDIILIGHNFGISDLANYFLDAKIEIRTAEYLLISFPFDSWNETSSATGSLALLYRPSA
jgi:phosphohistidine phosphatase